MLVKRSLDDGYLVGSRGSVGSSLVAYLAKISEVNPLPPHYICPHCRHVDFDVNEADGYDLPGKLCPQCKNEMRGDGHNIPFETFLGFEDDPKVPDIDLNFSGIYQPKAHNFIKEMFGEAHTYRAGTIATVADKTAYGYVKNFFEMTQPNVTITSSEIEWVVNKCVEVKRTTGQHPGGIIIVPKELDILDFTPYNYPADDKSLGWFTSHFAYEYLHENLLKFDILGHDDPTSNI
ncbi:DNA polymerase III polC-type [Bacteroidales bacterium Barb6]|nr:DNA polymerase III polC-type [Bacteroidales bacterium Barb6]